MVDLLLSRLLHYRFVVRMDRLGCSVQDLLDSAQRDGKPKDRGAEVLDGAAAVAMGAGQFRDDGAHSRTIAAAIFIRNAGLAHLAATDASPHVQYEMGNLQLYLRKLDVLVRIERYGIAMFIASAWAGFRENRFYPCRLKHLLPMTFMPFLAARFTLFA